MGKKLYFLAALAITLIFINKASAQITMLTPNDTAVCGPATLEAIANGMSATSISLPVDDDYASHTSPIGFSFTFYGVTYTSCLISSNGYITFNLQDSGSFSAWSLSTSNTSTGPIPYNTSCRNSICGVYEDILLTSSGTVEYATVGVSPNRKFVVTFCNCPLFSCTSQKVTFQIILYETTNNIEVHISHKDICAGWNSGLAIEGICDTGTTYYTVVPGRNSTSWSANNDAYQFVPLSNTSYSVAAIPFNPIPDASAPIYWYQSSTYLGSGNTVLVHPTVPTTYTAKVVNCGNDTSSVDVNVLIGIGIPATGTFKQPGECGSCNGMITLHGIPPFTPDTVHYKKNGVQQTPIVTSALSDSTITLYNLCAGLYDSIWVKSSGVCPSTVLGPYALIYPPVSVAGVTQPTTCGACNGQVKLHGLAPFVPDTVNYTLNGVAQPPVIIVAGNDSAVTIINLCAGAYNFVVKANTCISSTIGPIDIIDPPITSAFSYAIHYGCDGDTVLFTNSSTAPGASVIHYRWNFGDGKIDTAANPVHIYKSQGTFNAKLFVTNTTCNDSSTQAIALLHPIKASFTVSKDTICQHSQVDFTNTSVGNTVPTPPTYYWDFTDGFNSTATSPSHTFDVVGTYHVKLVETDFVPCMDSAYHTIVVDSISFISFSTNDTTLCLGKEILFTGYNVNIGRTSTVWDFGDGTIIKNRNPIGYAYSHVGVYHVVYTANYRVCPDTSVSKDLTILPYPAANVGPDTSLCPGSGSITIADLANTENNAVSWEWNTGAKSQSIVATTPGLYYVTVTLNGCSTSDSMQIRNDCYLDIPNVFSPNGDGVNDYFLPRQFLSSGLTSFKMEIFNRWGQLIFQTTNLDGRGWDGKYNDILQPEGVYVYLIDASFKNGAVQHYKGNVTLLR